jgi:long-chain fatty acid transport protein
VARADDPLAVFFNPAALARQATGVHLGAHLMFLDRCFTRLGPDEDGDGKGDPVPPAGGFPAPGTPGGPEAATCDEGAPFPNPQLAFVWRVTPELGVGLAVLGPHAVGGTEFPETVSYTGTFGEAEQPFAGRYLVTEGSSVLLLPTLSAGYAVTDWLSFGAGFIWGIASLEYSNFSESVSNGPAVDDFRSDVKATLNATDAFIPGFVLGGLAEVTSRLDIGVWFKWMDAIDSDADIRTESLYWRTSGRKEDQPCPPPQAEGCNITDAVGEEGHIRVPTPMEAKLGVRYHHPRPGIRPRWAQRADGGRVRDPMSEDLFDIEVDFTWANNSAVDTLELRFPGEGGLPGTEIRVNGTPGVVPPNADVPHEWKDVFGVRVGGDFVVLPNLLALRAGGFVETKGQDDKYLNLDFHVGEKVGIGGGATVRIGPVDVTAAFQHTFYGDIDNNGVGAIHGLSGDETTDNNRTRQAVNGGVLTSSLNEVALGGTLRF